MEVRRRRVVGCAAWMEVLSRVREEKAEAMTPSYCTIRRLWIAHDNGRGWTGYGRTAEEAELGMEMDSRSLFKVWHVWFGARQVSYADGWENVK